jgi:glycosyltransferase involved in cell wall biosynthesis
LSKVPAQRLSVALISTDYPPVRTSAAVQMRDLAEEFARQGHYPVVIVPAPSGGKSWALDEIDGVAVLRVPAPITRDQSYLRRAIGEFALPFLCLRHLLASPIAQKRWDIVTWYSPPIFFGPLIWWLKLKRGAYAYLILRDIFPEWAVDLGLMRKRLAFWLLKLVASIQYHAADTIGVQTHSNLQFVGAWHRPSRRHVEVLHNWQRQAADVGSSISIGKTHLAGRRVFAYVGNMGVAQGMDIFIDLADYLKQREDIGFVFVGRGSELPRLIAEAKRRNLENVLFRSEVDSSEMPGLLAQCHVGLLALDPRHKTHNIPGKFLTYMNCGLPVLARTNADTDLEQIIENESVGCCYTGDSVQEFSALALELIDSTANRQKMAAHCRTLGSRMFAPATAVDTIVAAWRRSRLE